MSELVDYSKHGAVGDLAGLDIGWRSRKDHGEPERPESRVAGALCELGRFGQKAGAGWHAYDGGGRPARPDPLVERLIIEASRALGMTRRSFGDEEILARRLKATQSSRPVLAHGLD